MTPRERMTLFRHRDVPARDAQHRAGAGADSLRLRAVKVGQEPDLSPGTSMCRRAMRNASRGSGAGLAPAPRRESRAGARSFAPTESSGTAPLQSEHLRQNRCVYCTYQKRPGMSYAGSYEFANADAANGGSSSNRLRM